MIKDPYKEDTDTVLTSSSLDGLVDEIEKTPLLYWPPRQRHKLLEQDILDRLEDLYQ